MLKPIFFSLVLALCALPGAAQTRSEPIAPVTVASLRQQLITKYHLSEYQALRLTPAITRYVNSATVTAKKDAFDRLTLAVQAVTTKRGASSPVSTMSTVN